MREECQPSVLRGENAYESAMARVAALQARDGPEVHPLAHTWCRTHGHGTERAAVFFHGYTSAPPQFAKLGEILYARGYNVLIPRLPHHGLADRRTHDQGRLRARELSALVDEAVAIARGLGAHVTVGGLSLGGVMAGYAAQVYPIDRAVLIAPAFGVGPLPVALAPLAVWLAAHLPGIYFRWGEPEDEDPGPPYCYPRMCTRALAAMFGLGFAVQARARSGKPAARSILVVTNANDHDASNLDAARMAALWRRQGAVVETYEFPAELQLPHGVIDPVNRRQRVDLVYPVLLQLMEGEGNTGA